MAMHALNYPEIIWEIWTQGNTVWYLCAWNTRASAETLSIYGKSIMANTYSSNYMIRSLCNVKVPCLVQSEMLFLLFFFVVVRLLLLNFLFISSLLFFLPSYFPLLFHSMSACFPSFIPSTVTRDSVLQALHWVLLCSDTNVSAPGALPFLEHWPALKIAYCFPGFILPIFWGFF